MFEVPPLAVQVSEHRAERKRCPDCGGVAVGTFPEQVGQPVQYGARLQALAAYLKNYGLLPYQRTAELFEDLFSIPISVGTLVNINAACAQRLARISKLIRAAIVAQPVVGFDETGMGIDGQLWWLHVASTDLLTYYAEHAKRGKQATDDIGILPEFTGMALHDPLAELFSLSVWACAVQRPSSARVDVRKNGSNVIEALRTVFDGRPMIPPYLRPFARAE